MHSFKRTLLFLITMCIGTMSVDAQRRHGAVVSPPLAEEPLKKGTTTRLFPISEVNPPSPVIGTYTTLSGFYDYQSNGGACQYIRINPANPQQVHVIFMLADDSIPPLRWVRRTGYAFSSDGGNTWNNFNNLRVPDRTSGFPSLDLLQGSNAGIPVIANHVDSPSTLQSRVYTETAVGAGGFVESAPPPAFGVDEPIWPNVAGAANGNIVIHSSRQSVTENYMTRTQNLINWSPWFGYPGLNSVGGRYPTMANGIGRVGSMLNATSNGVYFLESTDNGVTWSAAATQLHPPLTADSFAVYVGADFVYHGDNIYAAFNVSKVIDGIYTYADARIDFWSQATGLVTAVPHNAIPGVIDTLNRPQQNHLTVGWPVIGVSGNTIVIVFQAFGGDTSTIGFNYSDVFLTFSTNGGVTWSLPENLTNTPTLDERYPSIAKWNPNGEAYIVWQEDPQPGAQAVFENGPITRVRQVFFKKRLSAGITLIAPNGGEVLVVDSTYNITWFASGDVDTVRIDYSSNNGTSWINVTPTVPASPGTYSWTVPNTLTTQGRVRVMWMADTSVIDVSDGVFTISPFQPLLISVAVDSVNGILNDTIVVPVRASFSEGRSYYSFELDFTGFQQQGITFLQIDTVGTVIGQHGWLLQANNTDTVLITAAAGANAISGGGVLFNLKFAVTGGNCSFAPITISRAIFNTGVDSVRRSHGGVFVTPVPHYGDVDENGFVQAFDASLTLRHLAHVDTLGCQALTNANVSNDLTVSALDASLILMYVVGLIDRLPYDTTIVATGNIAMAGSTVSQGDTVEIPLILSNGNNIVSFEGLITFNPSDVSFSHILWSSAVNGFTIASHLRDGELHFAAASTTQNGSAGIFARLIFVGIQTSGQTQVSLRRLRWNEGPVMENVATATVITSVDDPGTHPAEFLLEQNYPNPFNPSTVIRYSLPVAGFVSLRVYNVLGQEVQTLVNAELDAGNWEAVWNASGQPSGVYFCRLDVDGFVQARKMVVVK
jgi:hypothetical protein